MSTPAFAGIPGETHIGNGIVYVKFFWTWDGARRLTNIRMEILDDECNKHPAEGSVFVYLDRTSAPKSSSRTNSLGCGNWQTFYMGPFSYSEDILNLKVCADHSSVCGPYIIIPLPEHRFGLIAW